MLLYPQIIKYNFSSEFYSTEEKQKKNRKINKIRAWNQDKIWI